MCNEFKNFFFSRKSNNGHFFALAHASILYATPLTLVPTYSYCLFTPALTPAHTKPLLPLSQSPSARSAQTFFASLEARCAASNTLLCVGLDPHEADLGDDQTGEAAYKFCANIIERTAPFAAAFKPNAAFFERLGGDGYDALRRVIALVPEGIPVVLDVKRGDISSTAAAYASSSFNALGAHSVTLSPYMGSDSVTPFLDDCES